MTDTISDTIQKRDALELPANDSIEANANFSSTPSKHLESCVYIYCPKPDEDKIARVLKRHPEINAQVNNYTIRDFKSKTLCHFKSSHLTQEQQAFLVAATELGAWVEPLVSYLDSSLGYTETELLHSGYFLHQKAFSILSNRKNSWQKRAIDLLFVFMLAWIAIPIGLITALLIKL